MKVLILHSTLPGYCFWIKVQHLKMLTLSKTKLDMLAWGARLRTIISMEQWELWVIKIKGIRVKLMQRREGHSKSGSIKWDFQVKILNSHFLMLLRRCHLRLGFCISLLRVRVVRISSLKLMSLLWIEWMDYNKYSN